MLNLAWRSDPLGAHVLYYQQKYGTSMLVISSGPYAIGICWGSGSGLATLQSSSRSRHAFWAQLGDQNHPTASYEVLDTTR